MLAFEPHFELERVAPTYLDRHRAMTRTKVFPGSSSGCGGELATQRVPLLAQPLAPAEVLVASASAAARAAGTGRLDIGQIDHYSEAEEASRTHCEREVAPRPSPAIPDDFVGMRHTGQSHPILERLTPGVGIRSYRPRSRKDDREKPRSRSANMKMRRSILKTIPWLTILAILLITTYEQVEFVAKIHTFTVDDAYITARNARNLADGYGPRFNPGKPIQQLAVLLAAALFMAGSFAIYVRTWDWMPGQRYYVPLGVLLAVLAAIRSSDLLRLVPSRAAQVLAVAALSGFAYFSYICRVTQSNTQRTFRAAT